jgi:hypothetical protein
LEVRYVRIGSVKSVLIGSAFLLATAAPVFAQGTVGAGLSFLHDDGATATGFTIDYASVKPATDKATFGFVGDFGLNKFDGGTVTSYLGGVRVAIPGNAKVKPFAQFVIGAEHCCGSTDLAFQPGAGVDFAVSPTLDVRVQVDFRTVRADGDTFNAQRYTFGIAIPVGAKQ